MTDKLFPFDQTGQKVGVQININTSSQDDEVIFHYLVRTDGVLKDTAYLTVDEAYRRNKQLLANNEPYQWRQDR